MRRITTIHTAMNTKMKKITVTDCGDCIFRLAMPGHSVENAVCGLNKDIYIWENAINAMMIECPLKKEGIVVQLEDKH